MARKLWSIPLRIEGGPTTGGTGTRIRAYDDEALTVLSTMRDASSAGGTLPNPLTPNAGGQTTLTVTAIAGDSIITVADVSTFAVGNRIRVYDGTNTRKRFITAINGGTKQITLNATLGVGFSNTNTLVGWAGDRGNVSFWLDDTRDYYLEVEDVATGMRTLELAIPIIAAVAPIEVQEEGVVVNTRGKVNYVGPLVTAADDAPNGRVNVTVATPTIAGASAVADTAAIGTTSTVAAADHRHSREAFATPVAVGSANAAGAATTVPRSDHVHAGWAAPLDKDVVTTTIVSSVTEADLYRKTILANTIGATGGLRLMVSGDALNNSGGGATLTFRIKFGATTLFASAALAIGNSASRHKWLVEIWILQSATNAQRVTGRLYHSQAGGVIDSASPLAFGTDYTTAAEDTTANKDLAVTGQLSVNNALTDVRQQMALLELIT